MAKFRNLFLFSDGTGNAGGKNQGTNVYRLYNMIDRHHDSIRQLTFYDDGVGTKDNAVSRALGGAFGAGLARNICQLYEYLVLNYGHDDDADSSDSGLEDRIFLFGFSRGAFTVRCLAAMVNRCGIMKREYYQQISTEQRPHRLKQVLWAYRASNERKFKEWYEGEEYFTRVRIHFLGVWDTVDAVGMPLDELRPIVDWVSKLIVGRRAYGFYDQELSGVEHARQALAIDDERRTFHPNVWHRNPDRDGDRPGATDPNNIRQVWFTGAHSNVGGGYPKDQLAYVTLDWMMGELEELPQSPIAFTTDARKNVQANANSHGRQYDPRTGPAVYYRYSPRRLSWFYRGIDDFWYRWWRRLRFKQPAPLPKYGIEIHASVWQRLCRGTQGYAPLFLPDRNVAGFKLSTNFTERGGPYSETEIKDVAKLRAFGDRVTELAHAVRKKNHPLVVARQATYGIFLISSLIALVLGLRADAPPAPDEFPAPLIKGMLPDLLSGLVDAAYAYPWHAGAWLAAICISGGLSLYLRSRIHSQALKVYEREIRTDQISEAG